MKGHTTPVQASGHAGLNRGHLALVEVKKTMALILLSAPSYCAVQKVEEVNLAMYIEFEAYSNIYI